MRIEDSDNETSTADDYEQRMALLRIQRNFCPSGCGPLAVDDEHTRHCPKCGLNVWQRWPVLLDIK